MPASRVRICLLQPESDRHDSAGEAAELSGCRDAAGEAAGLFGRLAAAATAAGYSVTQAFAGESGITVRTPAGDADAGIAQILPQSLIGPAPARPAYLVHEWLCRQHFDIVCAPARLGLLFYAVTARHQGLALAGTAFCAIAERLTLFSRHLAAEMPLGMDDIVHDEMERRTLALADLALFPAAAAADWAQQRGWNIPGLRLLQAERDAAATARAAWSECLAAVERRQSACRAAAQRRRAASVATAPEQEQETEQAQEQEQSPEQEQRQAQEQEQKLPLVSACIPHFNRPALLRQAIESLRRQTYKNLEIVVVDDASSAPEARAALDGIAADLAQCGGTLVRHDRNRYLGAARNTAVRHARGEFVFFLDDDDYAKPEQVATLVQVARATGADIVNSFCDRLTGALPPEQGKAPEERWLTLGNAPTAGLFQNLFGTASALFRKSSFQSLGGFTEMRGVGCEDWEMFARASLAGMNLQTVTQALYWYRLTPGSMIQTDDAYAGADRVLATYAAQVPAPLRPVLRFAHAADTRLRITRDSLRHCEALLRHRDSEIAHRDAVIAHRDAAISHLTQLNRDSTEQVAALSREVGELRSVCRIMLGDYGPTPQAAVDAVLRSGSWRTARILRAPLRWLTRRRADAPPRVADWSQAATVITSLQRSSSWELTGPLRALARLAGRR